MAVVALLGGLVVFNKVQKQSLPQSQGSNNLYGKVDSKVTLTEYVDFQCEACYAYYPTVKELKEKYKDQVKFQVKHMPIGTSHQFARIAASYAEAAAAQGKFYEMHDKIYEGQKQWEVSSDPTTYFNQYAMDLALDMEKLASDQSSDATKAIINADLEAAKEIGATGTPTFILNGEKLEQPDNTVEAFSALIDQALKNE